MVPHLWWPVVVFPVCESLHSHSTYCWGKDSLQSESYIFTHYFHTDPAVTITELFFRFIPNLETQCNCIRMGRVCLFLYILVCFEFYFYSFLCVTQNTLGIFCLSLPSDGIKGISIYLTPSPLKNNLPLSLNQTFYSRDNVLKMCNEVWWVFILQNE